MGASGDREGKFWRGPCLGGCYDGIVMAFEVPIVVVHTAEDHIGCNPVGEYRFEFGVWIWKEYR
jgi:hypothetical protein